MEPLARWVVGHDRLGTALKQEAAQTVAVAGGVGDQAARRRQDADQGQGDRSIAALAERDLDGDGPAICVCGDMDLGRPAAPGASLEDWMTSVLP